MSAVLRLPTPANDGLTEGAKRYGNSHIGQLTIADLTRSRWTIVATSSTPGVWTWRLAGHDIAALRLARDVGRIVTAQKALGGERYDLLARLVGRA